VPPAGTGCPRSLAGLGDASAALISTLMDKVVQILTICTFLLSLCFCTNT
jgi:hypothetical protein